MIEYIKNQAEAIITSIKEFEMSDYFTLNYKQTRKFSFTMLCIGISLYLAGLLVEKLIKVAKDNAPVKTETFVETTNSPAETDATA